MNAKASTAAIFLVALALTAFSAPYRPAPSYPGPSSLGPYSHDRDVPLKSFLTKLGTQPVRGRETYCFADKEHGLYLYATVDHHGSAVVDTVFVSTFPNCVHLKVEPALIDPGVWKTPEGIGIGSSVDEVLKAYRRPQFSEKLAVGSAAWEIRGIDKSEWPHYSLGDLRFGYGCYEGEKSICDVLSATEMGFKKGELTFESKAIN